jgi:hypothetical protein
VGVGVSVRTTLLAVEATWLAVLRTVVATLAAALLTVLVSRFTPLLMVVRASSTKPVTALDARLAALLTADVTVEAVLRTAVLTVETALETAVPIRSNRLGAGVSGLHWLIRLGCQRSVEPTDVHGKPQLARIHPGQCQCEEEDEIGTE